MTPAEPNDPGEQLHRRFAFAPRKMDSTETADSVSQDSKRRRNRQIALAAVIGFIVILSIGLANLGGEEETAVQLSIDAATIEPGGAVSLEGLSYKGVTDSGRSFVILADSASESAEQPDRVTMASPRARVDSATGDPITIRSSSGELMRGDNTLRLIGQVVIVRPDLGYTLMTDEAVADFNNGVLKSEKPVRGFSPDGNIRSGGIIISGDNEDLLIEGTNGATMEWGELTAQADSIAYNRGKRRVEAEGRAKVTLSDGRHIKADRIFATTNESEDDFLFVRASGGAEVFAPGSPNPRRANADEIEYSKATNLAILTGSVTISDGANSMTGDRAEIDLAKGTSNITSHSGRVGGVFSPTP